MPELPEVETIRLGLEGRVVNRLIRQVRLNRPQLLKNVAPDDFVSALKGNSFTGLSRRGKYLAFSLKNGGWLLIHLGMTGRLLMASGLPSSDADLIISFNQRPDLAYQDKRHLGRILLLREREGDLGKTLGLGPEPFSRAFTAAYLEERLGRTGREIKTFLLDQKAIAGLGNIYACEALFRAGIHPQARCRQLSKRNIVALVKAVRSVFKEALAKRGTSFSDYLDSDGRPGEYQKFLKVYGREGENCLRCLRQVRRLRQQARSSYFCPHCQRL